MYNVNLHVTHGEMFLRSLRNYSSKPPVMAQTYFGVVPIRGQRDPVYCIADSEHRIVKGFGRLFVPLIKLNVTSQDKYGRLRDIQTVPTTD
jgi:hypothetical protein